MFDSAVLLTVEGVVLASTGMLWNASPLGDDPLVHVNKIIDLARNFAHFQWDPRSFNGYVPLTGFAWSSYGVPAVFVAMGLDPLEVFHVVFLLFFLAVGPSVYSFARSVGARRSSAIAVSLLGWASVGVWGYVGGGAYSRVFTLPFAFTALALTYRYVALLNRSQTSGKLYGLLVAAWALTSLGDAYMAVWPIAVAVPFAILSAGKSKIRAGLARAGAVVLPTAALTSWYWVPLGLHVLNSGSPPSEVIPSPGSQVFWAGPILTAVLIILRRKSLFEFQDQTLFAMLVSLNVSSIYFLIMGGITPLWPFVLRIWAAYDSLNILSFLFPLLLSCIVVWLKPAPAGVIHRFLPLVLIIIIVGSAIPAIYILQPPDRNPLNASLAQAFSENLQISSNYRVSLQGRILTRWFPYAYPELSQTGGRVLGLDLDPFYRSWYETEVFYKDDLPSLTSVYLEDQPPVDVTGLIADPSNFATTSFWLDWYGVGALVLDSGSYPVRNTAQNFSERTALFSTQSIQTGLEPLAFVNPVTPSPILFETNASVVGLYSQLADARTQYNNLLGLLSYVGLDSRYVIPVYLSSLAGVGSAGLNAIITDEDTYSQSKDTLDTLSRGGINVVVEPSGLLSTLQSQGLSGSIKLLSIAPLVRTFTENLTEVLSAPAQVIGVDPGSWAVTDAENANATLGMNQGNLTVAANITDPTRPAHIEISVRLGSSALLASRLESLLDIQGSVPSSLDLSFASSNFTGNAVFSRVQIGPNQWNHLSVPYSSFTRWNSSDSRFATATGFKIEIAVPSGNRNVNFQVGSVNFSEPDYTVYALPSNVTLSDVGLIQGAESRELVLSEETGQLDGVYQQSKQVLTEAIVPLAAFTLQSRGPLDRIAVVEPDSKQSESLTLFLQSGWTGALNRWVTNENLDVSPLKRGFTGIVWKETFSHNWRITGKDLSGRESSVPYLLAGPDLIYVPLNGTNLQSMNISYHDNVYWWLAVFAASSFVTLVIVRRRLYTLGILSGGAS